MKDFFEQEFESGNTQRGLKLKIKERLTQEKGPPYEKFFGLA